MAERQHGDSGAYSIEAQRMIDACAAMVPTLRTRARDVERNRRIPQATIDELDRIGLWKVGVPSDFGGHEFDVREQNEIVATLARGCASTGWVVGIVFQSNWTASINAESAVQEVFAGGIGPRVNGVLAPNGLLTKVDDGYLLNGVWPFSSGSLHVEWASLGALTESPDGKGSVVLVLVPFREITVIDDWFVSGLSGTRSSTVTVSNVPVPAHRVLDLSTALLGRSPSWRTGSFYRTALFPYFATSLTSPAIGAARGALEVYLDEVVGRPVIGTHYNDRSRAPITHVRVAEASLLLDGAEMHANRAADDIIGHAETASPWTFRERARVRADAARSVNLALQAIETLFLASGGSVIRDGGFIQRAIRDVSAMSVHATLSADNVYELYGRVLTGNDPQTPLL